MKKTSVIKRVYRFYVEGFRSMTIGKTLWLIILVKLFVMFVIFKIGKVLMFSIKLPLN
jgi:hypothetical protein